MSGPGSDHTAAAARRHWPVVLSLLLGSCASLPVVDSPSVNQDDRVRHLVLHFTSEDFAESHRLLTRESDRPVSAHYLVPDPTDPSYPRRRLALYRLVPESRRAWHAGRSSWAGETALNSSSVGVEIVNTSGCPGAAGQGRPVAAPGEEHRLCHFEPYPPAQIDAVIALCRDILARHPDVRPWNVVGHADVAPLRKVDPGPLFPWRQLYEAGVGAWYDAPVKARYLAAFEGGMPGPDLLRRALAAWGYRVGAGEPGEDEVTRHAVRAFQMHFRPAAHDGRMDAETAAVLFALLEKYHPDRLATLTESAAQALQAGTASVPPSVPPSGTAAGP